MVAAGDDEFGQCDVSSWTNIVWVAAGDFHTLGLKSNGRLVAAGNNEVGQCDIGGWDLN